MSGWMKTAPWKPIAGSGQNLTIGATTVAGEAVGTGTGAQVTFAHVAAHVPIKPGSLTITAGAVTGTDNGAGQITGAGIAAGSTVNYATGAISVTFSIAPANAAAITGAYTYGVQSAGLPATCHAVQLSASGGNCHIATGPNPFAGTTDMLVKSTDPPLVVAVVEGDLVSVTQDAASVGTLNVQPVTH